MDPLLLGVVILIACVAILTYRREISSEPHTPHTGEWLTNVAASLIVLGWFGFWILVVLAIVVWSYRTLFG